MSTDKEREVTFAPCNECGVLTSNDNGVCSNCAVDEANPYAAPVAVAEIVQPDSGEKVKPDLGMRILLPVGRSGYAIAAGYLGLVSVLILPGPLALLFGILAIRDIKRHSHKTGMGRAIFGVVLGGIATLILGLFVVMQFTRDR